ncbi:MAG: biotin/lipoyl-binding protein, partial [Cyanobacteria bacterium P01_H01_bin.121]
MLPDSHSDATEFSPTSARATLQGWTWPKLAFFSIPIALVGLSSGILIAQLWQQRSTPIAATGQPALQATTTIQSQVGGQLDTITVEAGAPVAAGQIVAILDDTALQASLATAIAERATATQQVAQAQQELDTIQDQIRAIQTDISAGVSVGERASEATAAASTPIREQQAAASVAALQNHRATIEAQIQTAQANYDLAFANYERFQALLTEGAVSEQFFQQIATTLQTA